MPDPGKYVYNSATTVRGDEARQTGPTMDQLYLRLYCGAQTTIDRRWRTIGNRDSFWRLYVNNRDGAALRVGGRWRELGADAVHLVPAWVRFDCRCRRPVEHLYVHFDPVGLPGSITRELFASPASLARDGVVDGLAGRFAEARAREGEGARTLGPGASCAAKALAFTALGRLAESLSPAARRRLTQVAGADHAVAPALRRIDARFDRPLRVAELAEACCMSPDHFIRRFREAVGQTPGRYLAERRVAAAAEMLLLSEESIERIAARCGYADRFHFSRVFKRHIGVPPATYRRSALV